MLTKRTSTEMASKQPAIPTTGIRRKQRLVEPDCAIHREERSSSTSPSRCSATCSDINIYFPVFGSASWGEILSNLSSISDALHSSQQPSFSNCKQVYITARHSFLHSRVSRHDSDSFDHHGIPLQPALLRNYLFDLCGMLPYCNDHACGFSVLAARECSPREFKFFDESHCKARGSPGMVHRMQKPQCRCHHLEGCSVGQVQGQKGDGSLGWRRRSNTGKARWLAWTIAVVARLFLLYLCSTGATKPTPGAWSLASELPHARIAADIGRVGEEPRAAQFSMKRNWAVVSSCCQFR